LYKYSVVKINWLIHLNNDTLQIHSNIKFNGQTQYLFNYNMCKHLNINIILVGIPLKVRFIWDGKVKRVDHMCFNFCQKRS
jgi:hypothetical protein